MFRPELSPDDLELICEALEPWVDECESMAGEHDARGDPEAAHVSRAAADRADVLRLRLGALIGVVRSTPEFQSPLLSLSICEDLR